jgi:hypothetical protein
MAEAIQINSDINWAYGFAAQVMGGNDHNIYDGANDTSLRRGM